MANGMVWLSTGTRAKVNRESRITCTLFKRGLMDLCVTAVTFEPLAVGMRAKKLVKVGVICQNKNNVYQVVVRNSHFVMMYHVSLVLYVRLCELSLVNKNILKVWNDF